MSSNALRLERIASHVVASPCAAAGEVPLVVTLIGAGNSAHTCAGLIHENTKGRAILQILSSRPQIWSKNPKVTFPDGSHQIGRIAKVSSDPKEVLPNADIIVWTGPVTATKEVFENIRPYIDLKKAALGTIFAQGLVHIMAHRIFGSGVRFFALRNIPWLCRLVTAGQEAMVVGPKTSIEVMLVNLDEAWVKRDLEPLFVVQKMGKWEPVMNVSPDFCAVVFNPANQIIHPARYWGMFRNWTGQPLTGKDEPSEWLYRGMDEVAGTVLEVLDEELQKLKDAYYEATGAKGCLDVIPLRERLLKQYGDQIADRSTMAKCVGTNKAYAMAKTPVLRTKLGVMPNPAHRVVTDDIGWGLCVLVSIAERLEANGVHTPTTMMRSMIEWHQKMMGKEYLHGGKLRGRDIGDLVLLRPGDSLDLVANAPKDDVPSWVVDAVESAEEERYGNP